jgi:hypothetical protein
VSISLVHCQPVAVFPLHCYGLLFLLAPAPCALTLSSPVDNSPPGQMLYPLTDSDPSFLESLTAQSIKIADFGGSYEVYQLP